jgi:predicted hydrocarbon binding protein
MVFGLSTELMAKMLAMKVIKFENGTIDIKGRTVFFMPVDVMLKMQDMVAGAGGKEKSEEILFLAGKYQTLTGSPKYFREKNELKTMFRKGDPAIEMGREVLKFAGWGDNRFEEITEDGGRVILKTVTSPIASEYLKSKGKSREPVCHYLRGVLAGVVESIFKDEYIARETSCRACGLSSECIFEFVKKD